MEGNYINFGVVVIISSIFHYLAAAGRSLSGVLIPQYTNRLGNTVKVTYYRRSIYWQLQRITSFEFINKVNKLNSVCYKGFFHFENISAVYTRTRHLKYTKKNT